jgi:hypothetical protein
MGVAASSDCNTHKERVMADLNNKNERKDDVSSAPESGDPTEAGRTRGQVVGGEDRDAKDRSGGTGEEFESGRQDAAPRAGKE